MKRHHIALFLVFFIIQVSVAFSQNAILNSTCNKTAAIYLSPKDGDIYVPSKTTLIIRPIGDIVRLHSASDFSFTVIGSQSGVHTGKILISDDNRTIIFKPNNPFTLNEKVAVKFTYPEDVMNAPMSYSFQTTSMTESARDHALLEIQNRERDEFEQLLKSSNNGDGDTHECWPIDSLPIYLSIDSVNSPSAGNVFFTAEDLFMGTYSVISMLDNSGGVSYFQNVPKGCENFKVLPDNTFSYFAKTSTVNGGFACGEIERVDKNGKLQDEYKCGNGYTTDYHDFWLLPNNHSLVISFDPEYVDMTKVIPDSGAKVKATVTGAIIQEIDSSKNVIFQWRSWDHTEITDATHEKLTSSFVDYVHINTAAFDTDGNIIASLRHQDRVMKISRTDASTIWSWGGKHNQFAFIGDTLHFSHQHNPTRIANGHITLWDNGNFHSVHLNGKDTVIPSSRAVEYALDETHFTATSVWQYKNLPYSPAGGNVQRLPDGNTFICLGLNTSPEAVEVTPEGKRTFQLSIQRGAWCYRAYKFPQEIIQSTKSGVKGNSSSSLEINSIYPNPAQRTSTVTFFVSEPGFAQIELINVLGNVVRTFRQFVSGKETNSASLDLHDLPNGTYYCKLSQNGRTEMKMIVVQK